MNRYLIEVRHDASKKACDRAIDTFNRTGSHFLTNADWGCMDGEHKAWITVDIDSKEEALMIVPQEYRKDAKVIQLGKFAANKDDEMVVGHNH